MIGLLYTMHIPLKWVDLIFSECVRRFMKPFLYLEIEMETCNREEEIRIINVIHVSLRYCRKRTKLVFLQSSKRFRHRHFSIFIFIYLFGVQNAGHAPITFHTTLNQLVEASQGVDG